MKRTKQHLRLTVLALGLMPCQVWAQHLVSALQRPEKPASVRPLQRSLKEVLQEVQASYQVDFAYQESVVAGKQVAGSPAASAGVEQLLTQVLEPLDLTFQRIDKGFYAILPGSEKRSSSLPTGGGVLVTRAAAVMDRPASLSPGVLAVPITGRVTGPGGEALPGVTVVVKGTTVGTTTDGEGRYSLQAPEGGTLVFSYIGFSPKEVAVPPAGGTLNVRLSEDAKALEEIVVVGYGTQKKVTTTGSVSTVQGEEIVKAPVTNVSNALAGRLPGVNAVQRSGEPGADGSTIRIRGLNTLGNNEALIVVDGVPGRSLDRIDPNSIESINVLKDASAAIYGSQAANGVILVTTKRGKVGKPVVTLNFNQGYNQPTRIPRMANGSEYATLLNEIDLYHNRPPRYSPEEVRRFTEGSDPWRYPNTDWFDAVLKPWSAQNNMNASMSGGSEQVKYFLSLGSKFQDGYYYNSATNYKQYDFRSNIDGKVSEYVSIGFDIYGRLENRNQSPVGAGTIFRTATLGNPNIHAYWPDGTPGPDIIQGNNPVVVSTGAAGMDNNKVYAFNSSLKLNVKVPWVQGLSLSGSANLDKSFQNRKLFQTPWYVNSWDGQTYDAQGKPVLQSAKTGFTDARLTQYMQDNQGMLLNSMVNYEKSFGLHALKLMAGIESREGKGNNFNAYRRHYVSTVLPELFAGGDQDKNNSGSSYENARLNYFGRVNYNYSEKMLLEFVWRYDGSYIFPQESRYGFFPGVSLGYRLSEEDFWREHLSFIDEFKLRASYGQTGNDRIAEWQYLSSYAYSGSIYNFGINEQHKLLYEARIPNRNVTWEVANQGNVGLEAYLLNSKLFVELDYFDNRRSRILWQRNASVPSSTGLSLPRENIGKVTNKGFEFNVGYRQQLRDFRYNLSVNGGYSRNEITFWDEAPGRPDWQRSTGRPIPSDPNNPDGDLYYESIGIFRDQAAVDAYPHWDGARPGDVIFKDVNGDGKIDGSDRVRNEKNNMPRFTGGFNASLGYKQFDLSVLLQAATGAVRYISTESGEIGNFLKDFYDNRWTPDNPDASQPRAFNRDAEYWRNNRNTQFVRSTDYLRLKTLELGYSLPAALTSKLKIGGLRIYTSGYNLFTFSPDLKDFDPESDNRNLSGQSQTYPVQRVVNGGISLTF